MKPSVNHRTSGPKERADCLKAAVVALLNCTELQYTKFQYTSGEIYLKTYLQGDDYAMDMLGRSKIFWSWWRNHWANRDEHFMELHRSNPIRDKQVITQLYLQYNAGSMLARCIHPNSVVLNESYAHMVDDLIHESLDV